MELKTIDPEKSKSARLFSSFRLLIALMSFIAAMVHYMNRVNISFAIVCMTEDVNAGYNETSGNITFSESEHIFQWRRQTRGLILSSFFIGYLLTQIPTGYAVQRLSAKWILFGGMAITTVASFLSPVAAYRGWGVLVFLQIVKGLACGGFFTCQITIIAKWSPVDERSRMYAFSTCGTAVGSIIGFLSAGYMCKWSFAGGWPSIFYIYALVACVWLVAWALLVYDNPSKHPFIGQDEREYVTMATQRHLQSDNKDGVPWRRLLTSTPVLAVWCVDFTFNWQWYSIMTLLPTYIHDIFHLDIRTNGVYSCVPYAANLLFAWTGSWVADCLIKRKTSLTVVRKLMVALSTIVPAGLLIAVANMNGEVHGSVVSCLTLMMGFLGFAMSGNLVNRIDLAPKYVGIVQGISNTLATFAGIIAPLATTALVPDGTRTQWCNALYLGAGLSVLGAIIFIIFGSGQVQPWATNQDKTSRDSPDQEETVPLDIRS